MAICSVFGAMWRAGALFGLPLMQFRYLNLAVEANRDELNQRVIGP